MTERYTVVVETQVPVDADGFDEAGNQALEAVVNSAKLKTLGGRINSVEVYRGEFGEEVPDGDGSPGGD